MQGYLDTPLYHGGLLNKRNMHLHSVNLCLGEAHAAAGLGVTIFENSPVIDIVDGETADNRLMFGGGTNYSGRDSGDIAKEMRPGIERTFPQLKGVDIEFGWSGMAGIVINRIPQLGKTSPNVFYCQGYSGHGVATSHIMGDIMANAIAGDLTEFDIFADMRHIRLPVNEWVGNQALALGMLYYKMKEHFS